MLRDSISFIKFTAVLHKINRSVSSMVKVVRSRHGKKLTKLREYYLSKKKDHFDVNFAKKIVCNMSSYQLSDMEYKALSYGFDHHIPSETNKNKVYTEFENYFQGILRSITNLPVDKVTSLKTKLRTTCQTYNNVNIPYEYKDIIRQLSNKDNIIILRQDKGRGIVIMDRGKYTEK